MTEQVEFESRAQLEVLLRAGMELKFELSEDTDVLNGSPVYAAALNRLRESLISAWRSSSTPGKAEQQADWYRLARHEHRWPLIARRAVMHPRWRELHGADLVGWIETLAAPLAVDEEALAAVKAAGDELIGRD
ncbi:hypothetical protein [Streptomyces sp. NPDC003943]